MSLPEEILVSDELETEQPNPYRRRQKVIGVRRRSLGRFMRLGKWFLFGAVLPVMVFLAFRAAVHRVVASPLLVFQPSRDVTVSGNHVVSSADVVNAIGLGSAAQSLPVPMFRIDLAEVRKRIEAIPWIESATIARVFPDSLLVTVTERTPIAYANVDGRIELVDGNGVLLDMRQSKSTPLPVVYGLDGAGDASQRKQQLAPYEEFSGAARSALEEAGWSVSEVDVSNTDDLRVLLVKDHGTILAHFGSRDYGARASAFATAVPRILARSPRIDSVDLRFRGEVVVVPVSAPSPAAAIQGERASAAPAGRTPRSRKR